MRFTQGRKLKKKLLKVLSEVKNKAAVHISVLDLSTGAPVYAGFQDNQATYAASVYKLFVVMAVLGEVRAGRIDMEQRVRVSANNAIDKKKEIPSDPRPLLREGSYATVRDLVERAVIGSSNTAANVLIDLVGREAINSYVHGYGWHESRVTRKFLPRLLDDPKYVKQGATIAHTRHFAEFLYRMEAGTLIDGFASAVLREFMGGQLDRTKMRHGLPKHARFYHKTGWFYPEGTKNPDGACCDAGIVESGRRYYIVVCMIWSKEKEGYQMIRQISRRLYEEL